MRSISFYWHATLACQLLLEVAIVSANPQTQHFNAPDGQLKLLNGQSVCEDCPPNTVREIVSGPYCGRCMSPNQSCAKGSFMNFGHCQACPCPSASGDRKFGTACRVDLDGLVTCDCPDEYTGRDCGECAPGNIHYNLYPYNCIRLNSTSSLSVNGDKDKHTMENAVIWKKSSTPVQMNFKTVEMIINLINPCYLLPFHGMEESSSMMYRTECKQKYRALFVKELESICPLEVFPGSKNKHRVKRIAPLAAGAIVVVAAVPGLALGGFSLWKSYTVAASQAQLEKDIWEMNKKLDLSFENLELLRKETKDFAQAVDLTIKEESLRISHIVSYFTSKLLEGRNVLRSTGDLWENHEMSKSFFDYLNISQPCNNSCPVKYGIFHGCQLNRDRTKIHLHYSLPEVNPNLTVLTVDPFRLMTKKGNIMCSLDYTGPEMAIISKTEDCIYAMHAEKAPIGKLPLSPSLTCKPALSFSSNEDYFTKERCSPLNEENDFIQVKVWNNQYYIYCPGNAYILETKHVKCPNKIFTLPLTSTFELNGMLYQGSVLKVVNQQQEDPLFTDQVQWHLNQHVDWNKLEKKFDDEWKEQEKIVFFNRHHPDNQKWIWIFVIGLTFICAVAVGAYIHRRMTKRRQQSTQPEVLGLLPVQVQQGLLLQQQGQDEELQLNHQPDYRHHVAIHDISI